MRHATNSRSGFTLLEMMMSCAVGLIAIGGAVFLYSQALKATFTTSQQAEMQQDFRAAANLIQRDISMAGAGAMGQQGLAYNAAGLLNTVKNPYYPCSATACNYVNGTSVVYPNSTGSPFLYSILPGPDLGIVTTAGPSDIISVAIADVNLELNCYTVNVVNGTTVNFGLPSPVLPTCILPTGVANPPGLVWSTTNAAGLQAGDMVLFGSNAVVGVVTSVVGGTASGSCYTPAASVTPPIVYTIPAGNCYTVSFANESGAAPDPGWVNQPAKAGGAGVLDSWVGATSNSLSAVRLLLITYYLDLSTDGTSTPRLMRIQNGKAPAPVAENVTYLKFTYDVNNNGAISANQSTLPAGTTPAEITQVNIAHMTIRSQLRGSGYQGLDLHTSIAARNLSSQQEYPITSN
jgi:prepilin-type N-terminal cleavage/methylation domain-containing protein